jgi:hypothetical protein
MTVVVKAESLTKRFGEVSAVTDLSFALEAGTITGFLGPNGAGKPVTELRHSLVVHQTDCRSPDQRSSSLTRPPSLTYWPFGSRPSSLTIGCHAQRTG